jgi:hypothetical protein
MVVYERVQKTACAHCHHHVNTFLNPFNSRSIFALGVSRNGRFAQGARRAHHSPEATGPSPLAYNY